MTPRNLAIVGLIASPMMFIGSILFDAQNRDPRAETLGLIFVIGWIACLAALWQLKATGRGIGGRVVLGIEFVGTILAIGNQLYGMLGTADDTNPLFIVTDIAWPFSVTCMLVVGIAVIRAKGLPGWRRFIPLLCGFATVELAVISLLGFPSVALAVFPIYTFFAWGLMAFAILSATPQPKAQLVSAVS